MARRKKAAAEQELDALVEDWVALWQSEIAGLMADPELAAAWGGMAAMGNAWLRAMASGMGGGIGSGMASGMGHGPLGAAPGFPFAPPHAAPTQAAPTHAAPADERPAATSPPTSARPAPAAAAPDAGRKPRQRRAAEQPAPQPGPEPAAPGSGDAERMATRLAELERRLAEVELRPAGGRAHRRGTGRRRPPA